MEQSNYAQSGVPSNKNKVIQKLFANLPKNVGRMGNSGLHLKEAFMADGGSIPDRISKRVPRIMKALIVPDAEKSSVQGESQPLVFNKDLLMRLIREGEQGKELNLNIGMSACDEISPMFPAYLELALQRLKEIVAIGVSARLRIFSTASLSPILNGGDIDQVKVMQRVQKELIERYVHSFYADLYSLVHIEDVEQEVELMPEEEVARRVDGIRECVSADIVRELESCGSNHGGEEGRENSLVYAAYHSRPDVFQDEGEVDNIVSVGGPGEALFNEVRFSLFGDNGKVNLGIVVPSALISRNPSYLRIPDGVMMEEFIEGDSDRMRDFWNKPKAKKNKINAPGSRDLVHIGRCLGERSDVLDGLEKLKAFYQANQDLL